MAIFNKKIPNQPPENEPENTPIENETPVAADDFDFNRYFLAERRIALENVSYETTKPAQSDAGYKLTGRDTVVAQVIGNTGVKVPYSIAPRREGDIVKVWADPTRANNVLGWKAATSLADTMVSAWKWQLHLREKGIM